MQSLASALSPVIGLMVGAAIWVVLFTVLLEALKKSSPFKGWTCYVMAVCVSLLSVIGMFRMLAGPSSPQQSARDRDPLGFILLPYAAMGIAMLIVLLLMFLRKRTRRDRNHRGE